MKYVDGFLLVVQKKKMNDYLKMAKLGGKIWKKHGALEYFECVGDELNPKMAGIKFPKLLKIKPGQVVIFSYIVFKSKDHRNKVNAKVMKDPMMNDPQFKDMPMPFDMKKMAYGGFKVIVEE